jgi:hypothetical protein
MYDSLSESKEAKTVAKTLTKCRCENTLAKKYFASKRRVSNVTLMNHPSVGPSISWAEEKRRKNTFGGRFNKILLPREGIFI